MEIIGAGGTELPICQVFIFNRNQRVVVDGATSEWIPIISGGVLGPLRFILCTSEMFELVENRLYSCVDDSTLLAVVHRPADRPAVAASLINKDLAIDSGVVQSLVHGTEC